MMCFGLNSVHLSSITGVNVFDPKWFASLHTVKHF